MAISFSRLGIAHESFTATTAEGTSGKDWQCGFKPSIAVLLNTTSGKIYWYGKDQESLSTAVYAIIEALGTTGSLTSNTTLESGLSAYAGADGAYEGLHIGSSVLTTADVCLIIAIP